jgi:cysteine desulfurase / selenocysteine lyase
MNYKKDFPIFSNYDKRHCAPLVYLDSAATSQRPQAVLDAEIRHITHYNAAAHRGVSRLAYDASEAYEHAREKVASFINASSDEIIFTKSATESINLIAYSLGNTAALGKSSPMTISPGDEVVVTEVEHHANLVPWQELCKRTGAILKWIECDELGKLLPDDIERKISSRCKLLAVSQQSNSIGQINPVEHLIAKAASVGALTLIDACQSAPRMNINVEQLNADFVVFSGHKVLGPSGIGVLYGKRHLLQQLPPFLTGGSMIEDVFMGFSTYATDIPRRFEPGVPPVSQAVGLAAALDYIDTIGMDRVLEHELRLTQYAIDGLTSIKGITIYGSKTAAERPGVVTFNINGIHAHDAGQALDSHHIVVRVGHHCAKPLQRKLGVKGTVRASFHVYNDESDIDALLYAIRDAQASFINLGMLQYEA